MSIVLNPAPSGRSAPIRILQISDPHLLAEPDQIFAGVKPFRSLQKVLEHATAHSSIDCILSTGDIAQEPIQQTYDLYFNEVNQLNIDHHWIRGNHDHHDSFPSQLKDDVPQVVVLQNWCLILLNSQVRDEVHGHLQLEHLAILEQTIQQYKDHSILIALHHHTFAVGCAWLDPQGLHNAEEFLQTIKSYQNVKLVICGHVHQESTFRYEHIDFLSAPSTCVQFLPNSVNFSLDTLPPGYRILELYNDGHYSTQVYRLEQHVGKIDLSLSAY